MTLRKWQDDFVPPALHRSVPSPWYVALRRHEDTRPDPLGQVLSFPSRVVVYEHRDVSGGYVIGTLPKGIPIDSVHDDLDIGW